MVIIVLPSCTRCPYNLYTAYLRIHRRFDRGKIGDAPSWIEVCPLPPSSSLCLINSLRGVGRAHRRAGIHARTCVEGWRGWNVWWRAVVVTVGRFDSMLAGWTLDWLNDLKLKRIGAPGAGRLNWKMRREYPEGRRRRFYIRGIVSSMWPNFLEIGWVAFR